MDKNEYQDLLKKSIKYFNAEEYPKFLNAFGRCYEEDMTCFDDDINVFRFSLATYITSSDLHLIEYNRFITLLKKYLDTLTSISEKRKILTIIEDALKEKFLDCLQLTPIVTYTTFNNASIVLDQENKYLQYLLASGLDEEKTVISSLIATMKEQIAKLRKIIFFSGSRYKRAFVYLPKKPKAFLKEIENNISKY